MAWFNGNLLSITFVVDVLNVVFPDCHVQWDDLVIIDGHWTIDGIDPIDWCRNRPMD
jgi:hypothetical protein